MRLFDTQPEIQASALQPVHPAQSSPAFAKLCVRLAAVFVTAFVLVAAAAFITFATFGEAQSDPAITKTEEGRLAAKGDRAPHACDGQAWGAWNTSCASALSGNANVRSVGFVTVEQPSSVSNETILARFSAAQ